MAFNICLLDNLDYDDAEPLLEDYIEEALQAFVESQAGQAHIEKYPEGGFWIGTFIEMAYVYGGYTLPKMTKGNAQEVMEYILPRKLTLMNPSDTDDAIAELTAFWNFLDEVYRFRSAKAIAKYLQSIADKFPEWMFDPNRGGFAKQFLIQGTEAGFDMSTPAGIAAFQEDYNRRLTANPQPMMPPPMPMSPTGFPMTQAPADMERAFKLLGLEMPAAGEMVNPMALMQQFLGAMANLDDPDVAEELLAILENNLEDELDFPAGPPAAPPPLNTRSTLLNMHLSQELLLTRADEERLQAETITETSPGTILQDFQTLLEFIEANKVTLSGKLKHLSLKFLTDLNQRLSQPIELDLKRPQQKSYPNIHGLYLLLRATSIGQVVAKGKQFQLVINPEVYASWQQLNPTEKYFSLLEAWFIRSHPEMLGDDRNAPLMMGDRCLQSWHRLTEKASLKLSSYAEQDSLNYWPGFYNLTLMAMFGLVKLTPAKPDQGQGWRLKKVEALPFGQSLMALLHDAYVMHDWQWAGIDDTSQPLGELRPALEPYFPEWRRSLVVPVMPFRPERHIFKVSLGKIWRRIAIAGDATLADLSSLILDSVDFDHDHLDQFTYQTPSGRTVEAVHPAYFDGFTFGDVELATNEVKIGRLPLLIGSTLEYLFDFGDQWEFLVQLESLESALEPEPPKGFAKVKGKRNQKGRSKKAMGEILETHGEAPEQYGYPDEDW